MIKKILVICLLLSVQVLAANHYIRDGASGDGSDWNNAWDDLPSSLTRGDTYYISAGDFNGYHFDDACDGSAYIYIRKATVADHGTETGWNAEYANGPTVFVLNQSAPFIHSVHGEKLLFSKGYYDLNGVTGGGPGQWDSNFGFIISMDFHPSTNYEGLVNIGYGSNYPSYINLSHIQFRATVDEVDDFFSGVYQNIGGPDLEEGPRNITISYCDFNEIQLPINTAHSQSVTLEYSCIQNNLDVPYGSGQGEAWQDFGGDHFVIRHNLFRNIIGTGVIVSKRHGGSDDYNSTDWKIFGNIFYNDVIRNGLGNGVICDASADEAGDDSVSSYMLVYNNTFYNITGSGGSGAAAGISWEAAITTGNEAKNNIFYDCNALAIDYFRGVADHNQNWFADCELSGANVDAALTAAEGEGQHGSGDPFTNKDANDFTLTAETDAGTNLGEPYNIDMLGNTRTDWTRGALEFLDEEDPPAGCACPCKSMD